MSRWRATLALAAGLALLGACTPASARDTQLRVYAAASLRDVLAAIERAYETEGSGVDLVVATGSSAALRSQIEQGAPADLFLSADEAHTAHLLGEGLAIGPAVVFAGSALALVVPSDNPAGITSPADLAQKGVQIVAAGDQVPITAYAREVVGELARLPGYPTDFAERYSENVVSREEDVASVLGKVALGEADAGFVYRTGALFSTEVVSIPLPDTVNARVRYTGAVIAGSAGVDEARAFLTWLTGLEGQAILARFGFQTP